MQYFIFVLFDFGFEGEFYKTSTYVVLKTRLYFLLHFRNVPLQLLIALIAVVKKQNCSSKMLASSQSQLHPVSLMFWVSSKLNLSHTFTFAALRAFLNSYYPSIEIIIRSKNMSKVPNTLNSLSCLLATIKHTQETSTLSKKIDLFHRITAPYTLNIPRKVLEDQADEIKQDIKLIIDSAPITTNTAECLDRLHQQLKTVLISDTLKYPDKSVCFLILEVLCLANDSKNAHKILQKGGVLTASGILFAAYALTNGCNHAALPTLGASLFLHSLSKMTDFPPVVITQQAFSFLSIIFTYPMRSPVN